jgi:pimeloyl-ACP methyl ester carboxylesterase
MALRKVLQSNRLQFPPAPTALILDSSPGASGLSEAVTSGAPTNILLRIITVPPIALLYAMFFTLNWFRGNPPISYELRTTLNSTSTDTLPASLLPPLLPGITPLNTRETPRLYIYSHTDKVTPYPRLEEHIADATQKGFDVHVEVFKNSAHVTHVREDPVKYWAAVRKLWEYANSRANAAL